MSTQTESTVNNKRIAKNTALLYVRMLFSMLVSLYTSRVVLQVLGISDYGLNNVVGGIVSMFSFISMTLSGGTQRFLNYALGENNERKEQVTFSTAMVIHAAIAGIIFIITEIVGLYLLFNKMTIEYNRLTAAFWVFQISLISMVISIIQVPYSASVIAHERMGIFAYLGIFDVVAKLIIVLILKFVKGVDLLILFSFLSLCISVIILLTYRAFCRKNFRECKFHKTFEKGLFKEMMIFSGWDTIGCMSCVASNQGISILLNIFFNTAINAARGISQQVSNAITNFVGNFQTAVNPQITKSYAAGDINAMFNLAKNSSKYSGLLFILIGLPIFTEIDYILKIWLGNVPDYTAFFSRVTIIQGLIMATYRPLVMIIHATGKMKWPNIIAGSILMLILPVSYILLKMGADVKTVYIVNVVPWLLDLCCNLFFVNRFTGVRTLDYFPQVFLKIIVILLVSSIATAWVHISLKTGFIRLTAVAITSTITSLIAIYFYGMKKAERQLAKEMLRNIICKRQ